MKIKPLNLLLSAAAIGLLMVGTLSTSSCTTDQGHGYRGNEDSRTAVRPAYQRALDRSRRHRNRQH